MRPTPEPGEHDSPRTLPPGSATERLRLRRHPALLVAATALVTLVVLGSVLYIGAGNDASDAEGLFDGAKSDAALPWPDEGQAAVLVEGFGERGDLGAHGPRRPVPIASVTKVMTAYVILRNHPLDGSETGPSITVDQRAADESFSGTESTVEVRRGQELSQRRLLELMLIPSGNNIARLLARWDAKSHEAFVAKMNRVADDLGMDRTTYTEASGAESATTSTAADQLKLARQAMRDEVFRSIVSQPDTASAAVSDTLVNTNDLLATPGVIGIKTGSSTPAGGALMWAVTVPDRRGEKHLALGVVLHQRTETSPQEGLNAAFDSSRALVEEVQSQVAATDPATAAATPSESR
ncbi:D-alanyl-D-alanine carboxypeptidase family protein [Streptomyces sulphureus]|uniref:D-alanyl-D-alanine carboxypeptidase family protein n=1 Tax=Streptomyces sulphureus TaxID=47758 RepID=UPI000379E265|nr:serine hydrolase [Streptomyces sulphureus]